MDTTKTVELIKDLHDGQQDWNGQPYWTHPVAVMNGLPDNSPTERKLIALLHDVIEDCAARIAERLGTGAVTATIAAQYLRDRGYCDYVVRGVLLLTHPSGVSYMDYVRLIVASGHRDAMWVKLCDNTHNTDPARVAQLNALAQDRAHSMAHRYERSKAILHKGLLKTLPSPFLYTDRHGDTALRHVVPISMRRGRSDRHPTPQWLLLAHDLTEQADREFAFARIAPAPAPVAVRVADVGHVA